MLYSCCEKKKRGPCVVISLKNKYHQELRANTVRSNIIIFLKGLFSPSIKTSTRDDKTKNSPFSLLKSDRARRTPHQKYFLFSKSKMEKYPKAEARPSLFIQVS